MLLQNDIYNFVSTILAPMYKSVKNWYVPPALDSKNTLPERGNYSNVSTHFNGNIWSFSYILLFTASKLTNFLRSYISLCHNIKKLINRKFLNIVWCANVKKLLVSGEYVECKCGCVGVVQTWCYVGVAMCLCLSGMHTPKWTDRCTSTHPHTHHPPPLIHPHL